MKIFATISLIVIMLCQHCIQLGIYGYYSVKKDYIIEKMCVNKDKPQMHCDGKCYLGKQLKNTEDDAKSAAIKLQKEKDELFKQNLTQLELNPSFTVSFLGNLHSYTFNIPAEPVIGFAHPPA